jgi:cyclopropane fatty-acyl-phospholipid synthase-like methyltransferase
MSIFGIKNNDELRELINSQKTINKKREARNKKIEEAKKYNKDYFEDGEALGVSCYKDYRWLPELTLPMAKNIIDVLKITSSDHVLDYGCAKGYFVRALRELNIYYSFGLDISEYAIKNCDESVKNVVGLLHEGQTILEKAGRGFDWIICKDVLEHVSYEKINETLLQFSEVTKKCFIVVPLGKNGQYVVPEYEKDVTHVIREDLEWWKNRIQQAGFDVTYAEYSFPGVKENWSEYKQGNGFFVASRKKYE